MRTDQNGSKAAVVCPRNFKASCLEASEFVPVAIPARLEQSELLKADLEAYEIPAILESEGEVPDSRVAGGIPVLVPECRLEQASEIVGSIELNAIDDAEDDDFEEDDDLKEFEEEEDADDEEEFDDDLDEEEEEEEEDEESFFYSEDEE